MDSYKKYLFTALLILGVSYTGWLLFQSTHLSFNNIKDDKTRPDSFMKQVTAIQTDINGKISRRLVSPELHHIPNKDMTLLEQPVYVIYSQDGKKPWTIKALHGTSFNGGKSILLKDKVNIHEPQGTKNDDMRILTSKLTYYPSTDYATTDKHVTIKKPDLLVTAIGMQAYLKIKQIKLLSHTRGVYVPEKATS